MGTPIPTLNQKIVYDLNYTGVPVSESLLYQLGSVINYALDLADFEATAQVFTLSGNFTVPQNVSMVLLYGCGGGGGGSGYLSTPESGKGGNGSIPYLAFAQVTSGAVIPVTIGNGGAGGAALANGSNGSDTTFGSLFKYIGGLGGNVSTLYNYKNGVNLYNNPGGSAGESGQSYSNYVGGSSFGPLYGGGGGAGLGLGGRGSDATHVATPGLGFGAGGGAGSDGVGAPYQVGAGGSIGFLTVIYWRRVV